MWEARACRSRPQHLINTRLRQRITTPQPRFSNQILKDRPLATRMLAFVVPEYKSPDLGSRIPAGESGVADVGIGESQFLFLAIEELTTGKSGFLIMCCGREIAAAVPPGEAIMKLDIDVHFR